MGYFRGDVRGRFGRPLGKKAAGRRISVPRLIFLASPSGPIRSFGKHFPTFLECPSSKPSYIDPVNWCVRSARKLPERRLLSPVHCVVISTKKLQLPLQCGKRNAKFFPRSW
jgi:hypothetical protein